MKSDDEAEIPSTKVKGNFRDVDVFLDMDAAGFLSWLSGCSREQIPADEMIDDLRKHAQSFPADKPRHDEFVFTCYVSNHAADNKISFNVIMSQYEAKRAVELGESCNWFFMTAVSDTRLTKLTAAYS